MIQQQKLAV